MYKISLTIFFFGCSLSIYWKFIAILARLTFHKTPALTVALPKALKVALGQARDTLVTPEKRFRSVNKLPQVPDHIINCQW